MLDQPLLRLSDRQPKRLRQATELSPHAPGQVLTIQTGNRAWLLRGVRETYPKSESGLYGDPTAQGAAQRQREELVRILKVGWEHYERRNPTEPKCPWDLELEIMGPFRR